VNLNSPTLRTLAWIETRRIERHDPSTEGVACPLVGSDPAGTAV